MAENKTIELNVETNLGSLRSQLREAQQEVAILSEKFGATSTEAANAAKKAAELKDRIEDAKKLTDAFNPDAKFNALSTSIGGVLNGFQAFEGALGVMGVESEDLQKTLLKVQSAMALSQGIQGVFEAKDSFIALGSVVKNSFAAMTAAGRAFALTGIGLVVTAIGGLIYAYQSMNDEAEQAAQAQKNLDKAFKATTDSIEQQQNRLDAVARGLDFNARQDILNAKKRGASEEELTKLTLQYQKRRLQGLEDEVKQSENRYLYLSRVGTTKQFEEAEKNYLKLSNEYTDLKLSIEEKEADLLVEKRKKINDALLEKEQKKEKEIKNLRNEIVDEQIKQIDKLNQREQTQLIVNAERRIQEIKDSNATESQKSELIKEIRTNLIADLDKLDTEYYKKDVEAKKEADRLKVQAENDYLLKIENLQEESYLLSLSNQDREIQLVNDKYFALEQAAKGNAEQEKIIEEAKQRDISEINRRYLTKRWQMASQALSILSDATTLFTTKNEKDAKAQFKIQKAFNLSSAIINTALAVTGALTAGGNPIKLATGMQFVEAGIAAAAGAVNIAKISAQQFEGGNANMDSNIPNANNITQSMTPTFNIVGGNQTSQLLQGLSAQPLKAYVVASDITTAQMLEQKAIKTSVL
jgi:hypothetical protein